MKPSIITIGDITNDAFIELEEANVTCVNEDCDLSIAWGQKIPYKQVTVVEGVGNSPNASVSVSRLGIPVEIVTWVGNDDFGNKCKKALEKENVGTNFISTQEGKNTNYHYVLSYNAERTILVRHENFNYSLPVIPENTKWVYLSSLGENSKELHDEIASYLQKNKDVKLVFQPGTFQIKLGYQSLKSLYELSYLFVCNKQEAQNILNNKEPEIKVLLKEMHKHGPKIAVITDGPNGAFAYDGDKTYFVPQYPDISPPKERTGAGDAFTSALMGFLSKGMELPEALLRAPINSMSVVQYIGAQEGLLSSEEIEKYLEKREKNYEIKII